MAALPVTIMNEPVEQQTAEWYRDYYARKGHDRNNLLTNPEPCFQHIALQRSVIQALQTLPTDPSWTILDVGCGSGLSLLQFCTSTFSPLAYMGSGLLPGIVWQRENAGFPQRASSGRCVTRSSTPIPSTVMESTIFIQLRDDDTTAEIARRCSGSRNLPAIFS